MLASVLIRTSYSVYTALLILYPSEHRHVYGAAMAQLFRDRCREGCSQRGVLGLFSVWWHSLKDICWTSLCEHWSHPRFRWDLVSPNPNQKLPWKVVVLTLIPGTILLFAQVEMFFGSSLYFDTFSRIGYALFIAVVIIWLMTQKFPVWGLIPLGMVIHHLASIADVDYQTLKVFELTTFLALRGVQIDTMMAPEIVRIVPFLSMFIGLTVGVVLILRHFRAERVSATAKILLGGFMALAALQVILVVLPQSAEFLRAFASDPAITLWGRVFYLSPLQVWLASPVRLLLLVGISAVLSRRYGRLAVLVLLGYFLPTMVFGFLADEIALMTYWWVIPAVLTWRVMFAMIAPMVIIRSAAPKTRVISTLLIILFALVARYVLTLPWGGWALSWVEMVDLVVLPFLAYAMAMAMYPSKVEGPDDTSSYAPGPLDEEDAAVLGGISVVSG